nr:DNA recombination protein RmuC [Sulfobacillus harzensis]
MSAAALLVGIAILLVLLTGNWTRSVRDLLEERTSRLEQGQERQEKTLRDELARSRQEWASAFKGFRDDLDNQMQSLSSQLMTLVGARFDTLDSGMKSFHAFQEQAASRQRERFGAFQENTQQMLHTQSRHQSDQLGEMAAQQKNLLDSFMRQVSELTQMNAAKLEQIRTTVEQQLANLQKDNSDQLEKMRMTVDEKLHQTLEQRLGESFKIVSERLEQVQKGLGEMQTLASGVGDLKKVLTNVKTRGTLGEIQLDNILEQVLTHDQYEEKAAVKRGSAERVDFAIRLPGKDDHGDVVLLPIDAKFPLEDYQRLLEAQDAGDLAQAQEAGKMLENRIKLEARSIGEKYLNPPVTTDFAILFLPVEGLFAEVLRRPGLWESIQRDYHVVVTGPTTITALLNSLQMGFRTLAIQKRSSEVWKLLGAVKTEFGKFGEVLEKTQKKLQEASNTIESAATRTRVIERKLRTVEALPQEQAAPLLEAALDVELDVNP